jgi:hypothetical protein
MALAAGPEAQLGKLVIRNIGLLLSGRLEEPILEADTGGRRGRTNYRGRARRRV